MSDEYEMLYCDDVRCRVNTFERGHGILRGACPGCDAQGLPLPKAAC